MRKKLAALILATGVGILLAGLSAAPTQAQGVWSACSGSSSAICADQTEATTMAERIVTTLLVVLGAVAVIMIIWSGYKFVIARGDPASVKTAKDSLLYAIIGLIVAALAFAIVNLVMRAVEGDL